ncbi:MAG: hypothetical protein DRN95_09105 [Candidatus Hydrothermarchaeota archaeon]|nr:MAG: hypothetical protein DRN95_09105 [Candidatus Hydrothermarchaeota archaeon]
MYQLVAANHVNQSRLAAATGVLQRFFFGHAASKTGIDALCRFSQKNATQLDGVILAVSRIAADAKVHDPVMGGIFDEIFYHLRGQDYFCGPADRLVYLNHFILGQIKDIVAFEEQALDDSVHEGNFCQAGQEKSERK